jgi:hypothetical protein
LRDQVFPILSPVNIKRAVAKIGSSRLHHQNRRLIEDYVNVKDERGLWAPILAAAAEDLVPVKWSEMESSSDRMLAGGMVGWARSYNLADDDWCLEAAAQTLLVWVIRKNPEPPLCWAQLYYSTPSAEKPDNVDHAEHSEKICAADFLRYPILRCRRCGFIGPVKGPLEPIPTARFRVDAFRWLALFHTGMSPAKIGDIEGKFQVHERTVQKMIGKLYRFIGLTRRKPRSHPAAERGDGNQWATGADCWASPGQRPAQR